MSRTSALLAMLLLAPTAGAEGGPALPPPGEVEITSVPVEGGPPRLVARTVLDQPPARVWKIISDCALYQERMPNIAASERLAREGNVDTCKVTVALPFPLSNLTSVTRVVREEAPGLYTRRWSLVSGDYKVIEGSGELRPADPAGATTLVVYSLRAEPTNSVPAWLREKAQRKSLPELFKRVRDEAAKLP